MTVELPKDAEGKEIPLDTTVLYDKNGSRREVDWFKFYPDKDRWDIVFKDSYSHFSPHSLSITPPDSWEKLLDDLDNASKGFGDECAYLVYADVAARIRKLRSED